MTNVVLVHSHDTGRYIEPYGYDVPTPNLQGLADDGVLFRQAFCAAPTCSPSRGALMTGTSPHVNGLIGLTHRGFEIEDYSNHLAQFLSRNGYETVLAGQQHEAEGKTREQAARTKLGYDAIPNDPGTTEGFEAPHQRAEDDYATARRAAQYIRRASDDPYFLSIGFENTHREFPFDALTVNPGHLQPPDTLPDVPAVRRDMAGFATAAGYVDACVGHVIDALREAGDMEETLLLFTTDHGIPFPENKCTLFDGGIGVSLIARIPGGPRGEVVDSLVSQLDLFPTVCDVLDLDAPDRLEGSSIMPLVRGNTDSIREAIFSEVTYHAAYEPKRCVRTDRYKYIRRFDEEFHRVVLPNVDDGPSKAFLSKHDLADRTRPREALYDLHHDPHERENLATEQEYEDIRIAMSHRLAEWMTRTGDPLLDGPVAKPDGATITKQDRESSHLDEPEHHEPPNVR